jgi:adenine phosphoribosyltransferase
VPDSFDLDGAIRKVPDFPKPGILFYDVTSILTRPDAFAYCVEQAVQRFRSSGIDAVAAIEARGFVFAAPVAYRLAVPLILVRKKGKLPGETLRAKFALEYGEDEVEIHRSDVHPGQRVLLVDDLIATGGTLKATAGLLEGAGATVAAIFAVIGLPFLKFGPLLEGYPIQTLIDYQGE